MHTQLYFAAVIAIFHTGCATTQRKRLERDVGGNWSYDHPELWGGYCNIGGLRQSPIDIQVQETTPLESLPLFLGGVYNKDVPLQTDEHHVTTIVSDSPAILDGGSLDGTYAFLSLHFHFGSEHTVDGRRMDAEAHFVHYNLKYSPDVAMNRPDGLAVVAVLIQIGHDSFSTSDLLHNLIMGEQVKEAKLRDAFPEDLEPWIRYEGSLTTPPCSENVLWTVILQPVTMASLPEVPSPTYRPAQSISNRTVYIRQKDTSSGTMLASSITNTAQLIVLSQVIYRRVLL